MSSEIELEDSETARQQTNDRLTILTNHFRIGAGKPFCPKVPHRKVEFIALKIEIDVEI